MDVFVHLKIKKMTANEFELTNLVSGAMTLSETMYNTKLY